MLNLNENLIYIFFKSKRLLLPSSINNIILLFLIFYMHFEN